MRLLLLFFLFTAFAQAQVTIPNETISKRDLLDTIQIQNRIKNADTLMNRVRRAYPKNHSTDSLLLSFKLEEQMTFMPSNLEVELLRSPNGKANKASVNKRLNKMTAGFIQKPVKSYQKCLGTYSALDNKGIYIDVDEAYEIDSFNKYTTVEQIIPKVKEALGDEIDQETLYKIKSGWIPIDKSAKLEVDADTSTTYTVTLKNGEKREIKRLVGNRIMYNLTHLLSGNSNDNDNKRMNLLDPEWYDFEIDDYVVTDTSAYYIVSFQPDYRKAEYAGIMHIDAYDLAITQLDYKFAKGEKGQSLNVKWLLGMKFNEHYYSESARFERQESGVYIPTSIKKVSSYYIYIHRPVKFKENETRDVHKFDLKGEGNVEMVDQITINAVQPFEEDIKSITIKGLSKFTGIKATD